MYQNDFLKQRSKRLDEIASKPQPKRSQAEAYAQYDRLMRLSREEAIGSIETIDQIPKSETLDN